MRQAAAVCGLESYAVGLLTNIPMHYSDNAKILLKYYSDWFAIVPINGYNKFQERSICCVYDRERSR